VVNGSASALLEKLKRHYDLSVTPAGTDVTPLVEEIAIAGAVFPIELSQFYSDVRGALGQPINPLPAMQVFDRVFGVHGGNSAIIKPLVDHLCADPQWLVVFIAFHPERVGFFGQDPARVRKLWYNDIHSFPWPKVPTVAALLRNGIIPEVERIEAVQRLVDNYGLEVPKAEDLAFLEPFGFSSRFRKKMISGLGDFAWANPRAQVIVWMVNSFPLDLETVSAISAAFDAGYYPYDVAPALNQYFASNPAKKAEFNAIASAHKLTVPSHLPALA
jgi:hypothetical protein